MKCNMASFAIFIIKAYKYIFSPILSLWLCCRFYPTCSEYAILAISKFGLREGIQKNYHRLLRCRPDNFESCIDLP